MNMIFTPQTAPKTAPVLHPWLPQNFDQLMVFVEHLAKSHLVPREYQGNLSSCLIAVQFGTCLGLNPLQSIQSIAVINGRPSLWGDAALALVRASPLCESIIETRQGDTAICTVKRRGEAPQQRTFSVNDAKRAGLWNKKGPWQDYPSRMLQMRARGFALRDLFPDVLLGFSIAEEVLDIPETQHKTNDVERTKPAETFIAEPINTPVQNTLPDYPQDKLDGYVDQWKQIIQSGKQTAYNLMTMIENKYRLSESQKAQILALEDSDLAPPDHPTDYPTDNPADNPTNNHPDTSADSL